MTPAFVGGGVDSRPARFSGLVELAVVARWLQWRHSDQAARSGGLTYDEAVAYSRSCRLEWWKAGVL